MNDQWQAKFPVKQVRIARATADLAKVRQFYHEGLGLPIIASFENHAGYSGLMFGLPGHDYHLEFTERGGETTLPEPHPDDLLVFYLGNREVIGRMVVKLSTMGYRTVPPANPYWQDKSVTILAPDNWRVVLCETEGLG